ncbi:MAG: ComEC family competence protein, partial [Candidatus Omnitrophica bacterium]|nr:ComEC family competence protein [Candidatus Omnitrophota bacterium]
MKRAFNWLTVCFMLGIISVYFIKIHFWTFYAIALFLLLICICTIDSEFTFRFILVLLFFILGGIALKNSYTVSKSDLSRFAFYGSSNVFAAKGFVNSKPILKDKRVSFAFKVAELEFDGNCYKVTGDLLAYCNFEENLTYGEELVISGWLRKPNRFYRGKFSAMMRISNNLALVRLNKNKGNPLKRLSFYLHDYAAKVFKDKLSHLASSINCAMILGEKKVVPRAVYDSMVKAGTVHIMVVSGFHVGIIYFLSGVILKVLNIPRKIRHFGIVFCLLLYCLITGASTPVVRATIMGILFTAGYALQRDPDIKRALFIAMFFILVFNPKELFSISFQLSFASVAAIIYLYPFLKGLFKIEKIRFKIIKGLVEGLCISFSAWLATAGFVAHYFKIVSPVAVLANIFIIPVASLIILSGLSLILISTSCPFLS